MKTITIQVPDDCKVQIVKKENLVIRTYQDLLNNSKLTHKGYYINNDSKIMKLSTRAIEDLTDRNVAASEKVAKSMLAMAMISQLMPYYGGAITDEEWSDEDMRKHTIIREGNRIDSCVYYSIYQFLAFHTVEQRDNFFKYNEQLVKDYLMID